MNKYKKIEKDSIINPDFATSVYYGQQSLTEEKLLSILESDNTIYRKFKVKGYIISKEYSFITRATFDEIINSELDYRYHGAKLPGQREQAKKMIKVFENYLNSLDFTKSIKIAFLSRSDSECALYDKNRFSYDEINYKLIQAFES